MPEDTWESASIETPETTSVVATPVVDVAVPPAETSTLETTEVPQLEAEAPARESESQEIRAIPDPSKKEVKDEDVKEGDTAEILALPSKSSARQWARRQFHDAAPIRDFLDFDKPITSLGDELYGRSPSRYAEHVRDLITRHLGVTYEEAKTRLQANDQPVTTTPPATEQVNRGVTPPTEAELADLDNTQVAQRFQQVLAAQEAEKQALRAEFQKQFDDLKQRFEAVDGKVSTHEQQQREALIVENQNKLYSNVWSVVDEVIRDSGLQAQPDDPPKIAGLKEAARDLLGKHNVEAAFDALEENTKLVQYVYEATKRGEFQNAFREEDNLKVRARTAAETVKQSPKMQAILEEIQEYAKQSKGNSRAPNPVPPAPGSSVGINIKPPTTWDEAVGVSA